MNKKTRRNALSDGGCLFLTMLDVTVLELPTKRHTLDEKELA